MEQTRYRYETKKYWDGSCGRCEPCLFVCEATVIGLLHHDDNQLIKPQHGSNGTLPAQPQTLLSPPPQGGEGGDLG